MKSHNPLPDLHPLRRSQGMEIRCHPLPIRSQQSAVGPGRIAAAATTECFAFTRVQLLIVLSVLTLLAAVILPALAGSFPRSARVACANNLRQIGAAMQLWGNDHNDLPPWDVSIAEGGTKAHPLAANVWPHFTWMSNELNSAKILFCPSDTGSPALDFSGAPGTGYLNPNLRGNATSYLLSHAFINGPSVLLVADRNMGSDGSSSCSVFNTALSVSIQPFTGTFLWNTNQHNNQGNLLRADGRVEQLSNLGLRAAITNQPIDDVGRLHFIPPR